jgi:glycosyltransferase involved in cell wall biosynthesis
MRKTLNISFVSSYLPRQCGIATFTNDLVTSIKKLSTNNEYSLNVTALNDIPESYKYPAEVKFEIKDKNDNDFIEAAYYLNLSDSDIINIQHEFGLYGGEAGSNILNLLERLKKPFVTTLHTILEKPTNEQLKIIQEIGELSSYLVIQSKRSLQMLEKIYGIPSDKIKYIPHGAHDVPFLDTAYYKDKFQLSERKVILTFGLLSPEKGLEDGINALSMVAKQYPDVMYIILGATHPNVKKQYGEAYRYSLENLVKKHGLEKNVIFINRFVDLAELLDFLLMSDIYLSPYHNKEQIVSGTLTYALACGKAIISTPYWYAQELLAEDKGILVPFKDPQRMGNAIIELISDENKRNRLRKNAYDAGREIVWSKTAENYINTFHLSIEEFKRTGKLIVPSPKDKNIPALPELKFAHLIKLTDQTGIFQHSSYTIPNRNEGYCTDDNVRALMTAVIYKYNFDDDSLDSYIDRYLTFVHHSFNAELGLFRNFMSYERKWLEKSGSEDCNGRVIYVLGYLIKNIGSNSVLALVKSLFDRSIKNMGTFRSPRAISYIIMGCIFYLKRFSGAREVKKICKSLCDKLMEYYSYSSSTDWSWFEEYVTYDNARLPQSLLMAGKSLNNQTYITTGLESLSWLYDSLYDIEKNCLSLVGNDGWYMKGKSKAKYDQQPMEIPALIDACYQAFNINSDKEWINKLSISFSWFLGNNDRQEPLCDLITGGCFDGLNPAMINQNQGAESTICWLHSLLRMKLIRQELKMMQ